MQHELNIIYYQYYVLKTNFKKDTTSETNNEENVNSDTTDLTKEEFEEYISKSGAKGSFMVYRSTKKDDELGLDEL